MTSQAVSAWEHDEYLPESRKLKKLSEVLELSLDRLFSDSEPVWQLKDPNFNPDVLYPFLTGMSQAHGLSQTAAALSFMRRAHRGQLREGTPVPYEVHPLTMACHALNMGLVNDDVLAACLLHDVVEDTDAKLDELPVGEKVRKAVRLLSYNTYDERRPDLDEVYYGNIAGNSLACLVKCLDRCNNLSGAADGFGKERMEAFIRLTETYVLPLLDRVSSVFEWKSAAWLLRYQMVSMLETMKRLF